MQKDLAVKNLKYSKSNLPKKTSTTEHLFQVSIDQLTSTFKNKGKEKKNRKEKQVTLVIMGTGNFPFHSSATAFQAS